MDTEAGSALRGVRSIRPGNLRLFAYLVVLIAVGTGLAVPFAAAKEANALVAVGGLVILASVFVAISLFAFLLQVRDFASLQALASETEHNLRSARLLADQVLGELDDDLPGAADRGDA
jgi:hypothetical protein